MSFVSFEPSSDSLGLYTDMQGQAYVPKTGETDAPQGLKDALAGAKDFAMEEENFKIYRRAHLYRDIFTERACAGGLLGRFPSLRAMPLMLGHAGKLKKFGA